jgi:hypothetical protein
MGTLLDGNQIFEVPLVFGVPLILPV